MVIGFDGGEGKGSGRSVPGVDLGAAIARLMREGLIRRGGGHRMAAGLSLAAGQLEPAMARLGALLGARRRGRRPGARPAARRAARAGRRDGRARRAHRRGRPLRRRRPGARLAVSARIAGVPAVGTGHLALALADRAGGRLDAVAFRAAGTALGAFLAGRGGAGAHLAGRLEQDSSADGRGSKLHVEDAAPG